MSAMLDGNERALKISLGLTGIYFLIELAIGIYSGSVAVLSDAFHTFSAVGGVLPQPNEISPVGFGLLAASADGAFRVRPPEWFVSPEP